jgi:GT2 family glycosyltransferase
VAGNDSGVTPGVSIVISTRNRREDVLTAVESCLSQRYEPLEVLVYDDASTDGTAEAVRARFPEVRVFIGKSQVGYLVWRNRGIRDAAGEFVLSIDDDSYFTDADTVGRLVRQFAQCPRAAAIALPYFEPDFGRRDQWMPDVPPGTPLRSYVGCAHALRRRVVLELGGYREFLTHQGEERDLCIRLRERGWGVIYGDTPPLVHRYSPNRDRDRVNYFGYRNTLLFSGLNAPQPYVIPRMLIDAVQLLRYRFRWKSLPAKAAAVAAGFHAIWTHRAHRMPVSRATYAEYRSLPGHGPLKPRSRRLPQPLTREVPVS